MRKLKFLPWRLLSQLAILINLIVLAVELLVMLGSRSFPVVEQTIAVFYKPPFDMLTPIALGVGVGALAVYLAEQFFRQLSLNISTLWALCFCVAMILMLKTLIGSPAPLVGFYSESLLGLIIGVFWKGRPHCRY